MGYYVTMNRLILAPFLLFLSAVVCSAQLGRSSLVTEPGTIPLEDVLPKPIRLTVKQDSMIYYQAAFDRPLGNMASGTVVTLIGMSDTGYRVRGRARHGDVSGWMKATDVLLPDPQLPVKLKALYERQQKVSAFIARHEAALGMNRQEVQQALGKPTRSRSKITATGREETLEYAVFEKVPQPAFGRLPNGQVVESVIYVKIEVGTLSISFKDGVVSVIEETKGNPLRGAQIKIVPAPILFF